MCNVAWMRKYQGITDTDYPINGGKFIQENGYGHEVLNFKRNGNYIYGYVQAHNGTIEISRLDEDNGEYVDGVLVVWRARSLEGSVVIGWYKNARVYRKEQKPNNLRSFNYDNVNYNPGWHIRAKYSDVTLIPPHDRTFTIPVTHKGFGSQSFVTYLQNDYPEVIKFKSQLLRYIERVDVGDYSPPHRGNRQALDNEIKLKIEKTAIDAAIEHYTRLGYVVRSVESEKLGYDLLATRRQTKLLIEVKGTSTTTASSVTVGLTPNEYRMSKKAKLKYRICIVCNALNTPELYEFAWKKADECWFDDMRMSKLKVQELTSANLIFLARE